MQSVNLSFVLVLGAKEYLFGTEAYLFGMIHSTWHFVTMAAATKMEASVPKRLRTCDIEDMDGKPCLRMTFDDDSSVCVASSDAVVLESFIEHVKGLSKASLPTYLVVEYECPSNPAKWSKYMGLKVDDNDLATRLKDLFDELCPEYPTLGLLEVPSREWTDDSFLDEVHLGPDGDDYRPDTWECHDVTDPVVLVANLLAVNHVWETERKRFQAKYDGEDLMQDFVDDTYAKDSESRKTKFGKLVVPKRASILAEMRKELRSRSKRTRELETVCEL